MSGFPPAWLVDAFADAAHAGNPAGVILVADGFPPTARMQEAAGRLELPTTAFLVPDGPAAYRIRWFTPRAELNICGHATMASAGWLYDVGRADLGRGLRFRSRAGDLLATRSGSRIVLDLPRADTWECEPPAGLLAALGTPAVRCERASDDILIEVESAAAVRAVSPDFEALAAIDARGHIVTARADRDQPSGVDFESRTFFPALGVNEDQVCVSAHCKLAPYWQRRLGRARMEALQPSPRGGRLGVEVRGDVVRVSGTVAVRERIGAA